MFRGRFWALPLAVTATPEARAAIDGLRRLGVKVAMITGDARQVAGAVARAQHR